MIGGVLRRWCTAVLALCVLAGLGVFLGPQVAAGAASSFAMTGTVTGPDGPIAGAEVSVTNGQNNIIAGAGSTNSTGVYDVPVPSSDTEYTETVTDEGYYVPSFQTGADSGDAVHLSPASFFGTVTDSSSGNPIAGEEVALLDNYSQVATTSTDQNGYFAFPTSNFTAGDSYELEYHDGDIGYHDANTLTGLTSNGSPDNIALAPTTGEINGTVSDASGAVDGAEVEVFPNPNPGGEVTTAETSSSGKYIVEGLDGGSYIVEARPTVGYADQETYYGNTTDSSDASTVTVSNDNSSTTGIDFKLLPASTTPTASATAPAPSATAPTPTTTTAETGPDSSAPATSTSTTATTSTPTTPQTTVKLTVTQAIQAQDKIIHASPIFQSLRRFQIRTIAEAKKAIPKYTALERLLNKAAPAVAHASATASQKVGQRYWVSGVRLDAKAIADFVVVLTDVIHGKNQGLKTETLKAHKLLSAGDAIGTKGDHLLHLPIND